MEPLILKRENTMSRKLTQAASPSFDAPSAYRGDMTTPLNGWGRLATDGVEAYEIPGGHTGIYKEPNVGVLASTLNDVLHKAWTRAESERAALADPSVSAEPITPLVWPDVRRLFSPFPAAPDPTASTL